MACTRELWQTSCVCLFLLSLMMMMMVNSLLKALKLCTKKRKSTTRIVELPDDVLPGIFIHLPLKSVYKFRCVSKVWHSLLSNPCFIHRLFNKQTTIRSLPWASLDSAYVDDKKLVCTKTHRRYIDWHDGFTFKFMLDVNPFKETVPKLKVLDTSNGLVLCSHWDSSELVCRYYVCNPLTKQWVSLPSPQATVTYDQRFLQCFSSTSLGYNKSTYKVVIFPYMDLPSTEFDLQVFSSDTGEWNTYQVLSTEEVYITTHFTYNNGYLFCVNSDKLGIYNLNNIDDEKLGSSSGGWMQSVDIPKKPKNIYHSYNKFGVSEGFIVYGVHKRMKQTLSIWVLKEDCIHGGWIWQSVHKDINIGNYPSHMYFYFCPVNLDVVIFSNYGDHLCCFNLRTAECEPLVQLPALSSAIESPNILITYQSRPLFRSLLFLPEF